MTRHPDAVYQWTQEVTAHPPHLSKPQAGVLALWSLGMVLARSCSLTAVTGVLAALLERRENTVRQQLREFCYEAEAKRGPARQAVVATDCFASLLHWVLAGYSGPQLVLALDATSLSDRLVVLASASSCAAAPSTPGAPSGCGGCGWCWPTRGGMPAGCSGASGAWAGTPSGSGTDRVAVRRALPDVPHQLCQFHYLG